MYTAHILFSLNTEQIDAYTIPELGCAVDEQLFDVLMLIFGVPLLSHTGKLPICRLHNATHQPIMRN